MIAGVIEVEGPPPLSAYILRNRTEPRRKSKKPALKLMHPERAPSPLQPKAVRVAEICPVCTHQRLLTRHHLIPKSRGGEADILMVCRKCHDALHQIISHEQMVERYHTLEAILAHPVIGVYFAHLEECHPTAVLDRDMLARLCVKAGVEPMIAVPAPERPEEALTAYQEGVLLWLDYNGWTKVRKPTAEILSAIGMIYGRNGLYRLNAKGVRAVMRIKANNVR